MKKIYAILLTLAAGYAIAAAAVTDCRAQQKVSDVRVTVLDASLLKDSIHVELEIGITGRTVSKREQLRLYPALKYGTNEQKFLPVAVNGRIKDRLLDRRRVLGGPADDVYASLRSSGRGFRETVRYSATVPAQPWMKDAGVVLIQEISDCRGGFHRLSMEVLVPAIRRMEKPVFDLAYSPDIPFMVPPREEVKSRAASGEAMVVYTVGNAEIKPALGNNYAELAKIQRSIDEVRQLPGARISGVTIASYASPEGGSTSNQQLSERRAASLVNWVGRTGNLYGINLTARGYGEDWKRFAEMVEKDLVLTYPEQQEVLSIINSWESPDAKESRLRRMNGGRTFRYLLNSVFPPLRRSEYRIEYTLPEYTLEGSREIYKTHPQTLSLQELYALANEHEPGSPQFVEILNNAARLFPGDKVARLNMAAANLSSDNTSTARGILKGMEDEPDAWIYLGIASAKEGDLDTAASYLKKAAHAGKPEAAAQLRYYEDYRARYDAYMLELREWDAHGIK